MLRARKIVIDRGRAPRHRHCAKALSIAFVTFSLFRDVFKQYGNAAMDKTVPGNSGGRSYGKSVKKRRNTKFTHFPTGPSGPKDQKKKCVAFCTTPFFCTCFFWQVFSVPTRVFDFSSCKKIQLIIFNTTLARGL